MKTILILQLKSEAADLALKRHTEAVAQGSKNAMQSSILGVAVCGCVSDAGVESSNVHAAPVCGGVGRCVCESHVAFISIYSVQCVLHFYFIDGEGGGGCREGRPF